ncbi:uncharacterized protein LOC120330757 [Styela clava]
MPSTHCSVPGCSWSRQKVEKRSLFCIRRPDLARNEEEREHRIALTRFMLSMRDASRGDNIKEMLHKESASICEAHFHEGDIIRNGKSVALKLGARPSLQLPKAVKPNTSRKPPAERVSIEKVRHNSIADLKKIC